MSTPYQLVKPVGWNVLRRSTLWKCALLFCFPNIRSLVFGTIYDSLLFEIVFNIWGIFIFILRFVFDWVAKWLFFWPDPDLKNITYLRIKDSQTSVWRGLIYKATIKIDVLINIQMVDCLYFLEHVNIVHWYASLNLSSWEKKLLICLPRIINRLRELYHENFEWIAASSKFFVSRNIRTWLRISSKLAFTASKSIFGCPEEAV